MKPLSPQSRAKAIAVTGLLVLADSSWSQEIPEQPKPAPAPLKADPARDLYEAAQLAYAEAKNARKKAARKIAYENSQRTFERFLKAFPHDRRVPQARFYLASCYDKLGNTEKSFQIYSALANSGAEGPFTEAAAQQVANTYYKNKDYQTAEPLFARLATIASTADTRHVALFQRALCLQHLNRTDDLKSALRAVVFDQGSPYQEKARVAISALYAKTGEKTKAYANYKLLTQSKDPQTAADATLQTALLARELRNTTEANTWFQKILTTPRLAKWHGKAQLTLMSDAFNAPDYARVTALFEQGKFKLTRDEEAQSLAMAAESYRQLNQEEKANKLYARLSRVSTDKDQAFDAAYAVLTREYKTGTKSFFKSGENFLQRYEKNHGNDARVDNVHLMLAEKYSSQQKFKDAARQYNQINLSRIDASNIPRVRYRLAYARLKSGDKARARDSFNVFLSKHPNDKNAIRALAHRAGINEALGAEEAAVTDYEHLLTRTQEPTLRLQALSAMAEIFRAKEDFPRLVTTHQGLLKEFPKRPAREVAASHFILAWSYFKQNKHDLALPEFVQARELNPKGLGKDVTIHIALIHFANQNQEALQVELDRLLKEFPGSDLPRPVYAWLGAKFASEGAYSEAWKYLPKAVTLKKPNETKIAVWKAYSQSAEVLGHYKETLESCDILIPQENSPYLKAVLLHRKAKGLLGLWQYSSASEVAKRALELKPQGELNGELRITLGDIAAAQEQVDEALGHYVVVAEIIGKDAVKTKALKRAIAIYEKKGDSSSLASAANYRKLLPAK